MNPLTTQEQYEELWFGRALTPGPYIIWFTAAWCQPCKKLDAAAIEAAAATAGATLYRCDAAVNKYTPGYCDIRGFPTFFAFRPGHEIGRLTSSNTNAVCAWVQTTMRTVTAPE